MSTPAGIDFQLRFLGNVPGIWGGAACFGFDYGGLASAPPLLLLFTWMLLPGVVLSQCPPLVQSPERGVAAVDLRGN